MAFYVVIRSELIRTAEEAKDYYNQRIVGLRDLNCRGKIVRVFFDRSVTHMYSEDLEPDSDGPIVTSRLKGGRIEERLFSLDRAHLMDRVFEAIERFTVSVPGTGEKGRQNTLLHGPRLPDGRYLRVVLRPGGPGDFTCVTAYPISAFALDEMRRSKSARFPP